MVSVRVPPSWALPESAATPEDVYRSRRVFLRQAAATAAGTLLFSGLGCAGDGDGGGPAKQKAPDPLAAARAHPLKAARNKKYDASRPASKEELTATYNNYYEFSTDKQKVWSLAQHLTTSPWNVEVAGLCKNKGTYDADALRKRFDLEERLYRFRCVEAWAMTVPWLGVPFKKFLDWVEPTAEAKYVRFTSFYRPAEAPGQKNTFFSWPYYEALRMDEASCELTMLVFGMYGHVLPNQDGAPLRMIVPWKYGYKSPKGIVKIEFTKERPHTFWSDLYPEQYGFFSNIDPDAHPGQPHARWSQKTEHRIGSNVERPTVLYNGYGEYVASFYK